MQKRIRAKVLAGRDWAMESRRRCALTVIGIAAAFGLIVTIGSSLWMNYGVNTLFGTVAAPEPTATVKTLTPEERKMKDRGDGPVAPTAGSTGTPATAAPWPDTVDVDRQDPTAVAGEFTRRWLAGAGRSNSEHDEWTRRVSEYASPGFKVDLRAQKLGQIVPAEVTDVSTATVIADQATVTATLSTGQILAVRLTRVNGADGETVWAVKSFNAAY